MTQDEDPPVVAAIMSVSIGEAHRTNTETGETEYLGVEVELKGIDLVRADLVCYGSVVFRDRGMAVQFAETIRDHFRPTHEPDSTAVVELNLGDLAAVAREILGVDPCSDCDGCDEGPVPEPMNDEPA